MAEFRGSRIWVHPGVSVFYHNNSASGNAGAVSFYGSVAVAISEDKPRTLTCNGVATTGRPTNLSQSTPVYAPASQLPREAMKEVLAANRTSSNGKALVGCLISCHRPAPLLREQSRSGIRARSLIDLPRGVKLTWNKVDNHLWRTLQETVKPNIPSRS